MSIPEPVDKAFREAFVAADQDLFWLAGHGALERAARGLRIMRAAIEAETEQGA